MNAGVAGRGAATTTNAVTIIRNWMGHEVVPMNKDNASGHATKIVPTYQTELASFQSGGSAHKIYWRKLVPPPGVPN